MSNGSALTLVISVSARRSTSDTARLATPLLAVHTIVQMIIEFDPEKAAVNPLNHDGVTFDEATPVLLDPFALTNEDAHAVGEPRFVTLGMGGRGRILIVVWTLRGDNPRLISAWKANKPQRSRYEQQF